MVIMTKEQVTNINKPRYNAFQCGNGIVVSEKYKNRKSKKYQKMKNDLKKYLH